MNKLDFYLTDDPREALRDAIYRAVRLRRARRERERIAVSNGRRACSAGSRAERRGIRRHGDCSWSYPSAARMSRSERELRWTILQHATNLEREGLPIKHDTPASIETLKITARARATAQRSRADEVNTTPRR
jgi:hypothetical protein